MGVDFAEGEGGRGVQGANVVSWHHTFCCFGIWGSSISKIMRERKLVPGLTDSHEFVARVQACRADDTLSASWVFL